MLRKLIVVLYQTVCFEYSYREQTMNRHPYTARYNNMLYQTGCFECSCRWLKSIETKTKHPFASPRLMVFRTRRAIRNTVVQLTVDSGRLVSTIFFGHRGCFNTSNTTIDKNRNKNRIWFVCENHTGWTWEQTTSERNGRCHHRRKATTTRRTIVVGRRCRQRL